jgi:hypothetical protein
MIIRVKSRASILCDAKTGRPSAPAALSRD